VKVVIFGATGKIGCYLVDYILRYDPKIEIVAIGHRKENIFQSGIEYVPLSIERESEFNKLPKCGVDAIIHLAGAVTTRVNSEDVRTYVQSNIVGAVNIFEYAQSVGVDRILYAQTYNDVFGDADSELYIRPDANRKKVYRGEAALYSITKNTAVDLLQFYSEKYGIKRFVFRLPSVYSYTPSPYYLVGGKKRIRPFRKMIQQAQDGAPIEIWGNPNHVMDMVYIKDCCQMFYLGLKNAGNGGVYNVGTGIGTTLQEQVEGIIEVFSEPGRRSKIVYCPEKPNGKAFIMDISNAVQELGYCPQYSYIEMLHDMKREMEAQRSEIKFIL
jgi:UDP-glucose 4-epimerase